MTEVVETRAARGRRKQLIGRVVSALPEKSVVVEIETRERHGVFKKMVKRTRRFMAHDEANEGREGDTVRIVETRPMSRRKRWRLVEIVERAK